MAVTVTYDLGAGKPCTLFPPTHASMVW
jgi:hypothetical protein